MAPHSVVSVNRTENPHRRRNRSGIVVLATGITRARRAAGLSQRKLARKAGVSTTTLNELEGALIDPRFTTVQKIARALLMSTDGLIEAGQQRKKKLERVA